MKYVEFAFEWNKVCKRLKKSGYDLSKIKITAEAEGQSQKRCKKCI